MNYKNIDDLYTSNNFEDIIKFYSYFGNKNEIINWMKKRPKMKPNLVEYFNNTNNYIIVVIPTINSNGKQAISIKKIFKNLHIIFAENKNQKPNKYFNYAFSVNTAIRRALEYNPRWIIISNDDIFKIDSISQLVRELKNSEKYDTLFFPKSVTYSDKLVLAKPAFQNLIRPFFYWRRQYKNITKKFKIKFEVLDFKNQNFFYKYFLYRPVIKIKHHQGSFIVLNTDFIFSISSKGKVFDETFINGHEDIWLSYRYLQNCVFKLSNFNIGHIGGSSLSVGVIRVFRDIVNEIYFEFLLEKEDFFIF
jgi:hypothetical protein